MDIYVCLQVHIKGSTEGREIPFIWKTKWIFFSKSDLSKNTQKKKPDEWVLFLNLGYWIAHLVFRGENHAIIFSGHLRPNFQILMLKCLTDQNLDSI